MKACPAWGVVGGPQAAAMRFNYGTADPQSHTGAVRFGGEERIEDLIRLPGWQPNTRIADGHQKVLVFGSLGFDGEFPHPVYALHRIDAVHHQVHQHLLQLHAIPHDGGKICREFRPD